MASVYVFYEYLLQVVLAILSSIHTHPDRSSRSRQQTCMHGLFFFQAVPLTGEERVVYLFYHGFFACKRGKTSKTFVDAFSYFVINCWYLRARRDGRANIWGRDRRSEYQGRWLILCARDFTESDSVWMFLWLFDWMVTLLTRFIRDLELDLGFYQSTIMSWEKAIHFEERIGLILSVLFEFCNYSRNVY